MRRYWLNILRSPWPERALLAYSVAVVGTLVATVARSALTPVLGDSSHYIVYYLSVAIAAIVGGFWPAALAVTLGAVVATVHFGAAPFSDREDLVRFVLFIATGVMTAAVGQWAVEFRRQAFAKTAALQDALDSERQALAAKQRALVEAEQAEDLLRQSDNRLRVALSAAELGTWTYRISDGRWELDERAQALYGVSAVACHSDELLCQIMHPDDIQQMWQCAETACDPSGDGHYVCEYRMRKADGGYRWLRAWAQVEFAGEGAERHAVQMVGCTRDVTRSREAAALLRRSEEQFRQAFSHAAVGMALTDMNGVFVQVNPAYCELTGYSEVELVGGLSFREITVAEDLPGNLEALKEVAEGRRPAFFVEKRYIRKNGETVWVRASVSTRRDPENRPFQLVAIVEDITARKLAEEALRRNEATLRAVLDALPVGVLIADAEGRLVRANQAHDRLWGIAPETTNWKQYGDWVGYWPDTGRRIAAREWAMARALLDGETIAGELVQCQPFGQAERRYFLNNAAPVRDADGKVIAGVVAELDVTQLKDAERELEAAKATAEQARAAAEEASVAKDHFLAVLSHELRTPLTPVLASLWMLESRAAGLDPDMREHLEMIRRNVEMEARLIDDLLDVTRIVRGKIHLDRTSIMLADAIRHAAEVCRPDIDVRQLHLHLELEVCAQDRVFADAARLQQVFWNLLKNAAKFTPPGGSIHVRCHRDGESVTAEVADNGEGIDAALLPHIFSPFEQGGPGVTRRFGGLGLGLTITRGLVEMHGGTITAQSEGKGRGAVFRVTLPVHEVAEERAGRNGEAMSAVAAVTLPRALRILLVEDHVDTARIMGRLLAGRGHEVHTAGTVASAVRMTQASQYDLLLSDLGLPDGSGLEIMRQIRERGIAMPGIALSGYGQDEDLHRSRAAGFGAHLVKPVDLRRLQDTIERVTGS